MKCPYKNRVYLFCDSRLQASMSFLSSLYFPSDLCRPWASSVLLTLTKRVVVKTFHLPWASLRWPRRQDKCWSTSLSFFAQKRWEIEDFLRFQTSTPLGNSRGLTRKEWDRSFGWIFSKPFVRQLIWQPNTSFPIQQLVMKSKNSRDIRVVFWARWEKDPLNRLFVPKNCLCT